jgi:tRNA/rRNA methyltransferase
MGEKSPKRLGISAAAGELHAAPAVVLVNPQLGENIGAVARAMLNFGLGELRLVNPRDGWPNPAARGPASGADLVLDRAAVFETLDEALADCRYVLATTARPRELLTPVVSPEDAARELAPRIFRGEKCAVLFGAERAGLTNDELLKADAIISLPVNPAFASLNIAQAVLVVAYEWAKVDGRTNFTSELDTARPATKGEFEGFMGHLIGALDAAGYFFPPHMRGAMEKNLRATFARAGLTEQEVRSLRGLVKTFERWAQGPNSSG